MQPSRVTTNRSKLPAHTQRPDTTVAPGKVLIWLSVTGFAWLALVALVLGYPWQAHILEHHWLVAGAAALVALVTCAPVEAVLRVYGLTIRGVFGTVVVTHVIVFTAVPSRSMLALPEVPVYLAMAVGSLFFVASVTMPMLYALGKRVFTRRERRYDIRRAWRQATVLGAAVSGSVILVGLRAFTPILAGLWVLMLVFFEYIVLTVSEPRGEPRA